MKENHLHQQPLTGRGGYRPGAGRPPKPDKDQWGRVSCILRHETIQALREGAQSKNVGNYLQQHLDRYPIPNTKPRLQPFKVAPLRPRTRPRVRPIRAMNHKTLVKRLAALVKK